MKKGELSLQVVVVAAILLIVLVVLIAIFTNNIGQVPWAVKSCEVKGGICKSACINDDVFVPGTDCQDNEDLTKCCKSLPGGDNG